MQRIRRVAVLGAGVMGSGIAAHLANAGIPTLLLDVVPGKPAPGEDPASPRFRNGLALAGIANLAKARPPQLVVPRAATWIRPGNFEDDLPELAGCDWIVEAVKEDLAIKQAVFARVERWARPDAIVSSNTSGLSIARMLEGRTPEFRKRFLVTHFFNPVRYMKLLELVPGPDTDPAVVERLHRFGEELLGKGIVYGKDTTNFVANRIGVYAMLKTIAEMEKAELSIEEVDAIFGPAMGRPKSAIFRTADIVGLDTFAHVAKNCFDTLVDDEGRDVFRLPPSLAAMIAKGLLGEKAGGGFYRRVKGGEPEVLDLAALAYRPAHRVAHESLARAKRIDDVRARVGAVMHGEDRAAKFAEGVTLDVLAYASRRIPEIADDVAAVDRGMRWGFGWELGPFELWDAYGVREGVDRMRELGIAPAPWVLEMLAHGRDRFYAVKHGRDTEWSGGAERVVPENPRALRVEHLRRTGRRVAGNPSASVWDLGDGVALLEFHTKMNAIDDATVAALDLALDEAERNFRALVIGNDGANFSAGANLVALSKAIADGNWEWVRNLSVRFQRANQRLRYSPIPVVAAPFGLTLGGGAEVTLGANAVQAHAELYAGLVEAGVGVIPAGGGTMGLLRAIYGPHASDPTFDPFPFVKKAFLAIGMARVSSSAEDARELGFPVHGVSMNRDFLLSDAKALALGLANAGFVPPRPTVFRLPGRSGAATIDMLLYDMVQNGHATEHDRLIGRKLAAVLTGGDVSPAVPVTEDRLLELEVEAFLSLCGEPKSLARMKHLLETGKPLRN
jgi:3-hydroxyacyl-CoA dehydrogenase